MAKLKAPLLSLGASQQLGKTLVFFAWKGLNVAREYVVPSNPKTAAQLTQRGYVTTMVAAVHAAQADADYPLVEDDQVAYSALATAKGKIMTWFNMAVKLGIDALVAGKARQVYGSGGMDDTDKDDFRPAMGIHDDGVSQLAAGHFWLGTSKSNLNKSLAGNVNVGNWVNLGGGDGFDGLTAGVKYYWQFRPDAADPVEGSDSGIYSAVAT